MPRRGDGGFALLEVLIALAITALVVTGAATVLSQTSDLLRMLRSQASTIEHDEVMRLRLSELLTTVLDQRPLQGDRRALSFPAWIAFPGGEAVVATIHLVTEAATAPAHIRLESPERAGRASGYKWNRGPTAIRYLDAGGRWLDVWSDVALPRLIRLEFGPHPPMLVSPQWHRACAPPMRDGVCDAEVTS